MLLNFIQNVRKLNLEPIFCPNTVKSRLNLGFQPNISRYDAGTSQLLVFLSAGFRTVFTCQYLKKDNKLPCLFSLSAFQKTRKDRTKPMGTGSLCSALLQNQTFAGLESCQAKVISGGSCFLFETVRLLAPYTGKK